MGELAALVASLCWAVASLLFTRLRADVGAVALNLGKCAVGLGFMCAVLSILDAGPWPGRIAGWDLVWLGGSGLIGLTLGDSCYFLALSRIGARRALLLTALTPPITALMALPALGEPITLRMLVGMAVTLGGVAWVVAERMPEAASGDGTRPRGFGASGLGLGLVAAACQAGANVLTKAGDGGYDALEISVVRLAFGTVGLGLSVTLFGGGLRAGLRPLVVSGRTAGVFLVATFVGTFLGIWLQVAGLTLAPVGIAATLSSTAPVFVLPLSVFVLKEKLSGRAVAGAIIAVIGVAILFLW